MDVRGSTSVLYSNSRDPLFDRWWAGAKLRYRQSAPIEA